MIGFMCYSKPTKNELLRFTQALLQQLLIKFNRIVIF